MYKLVLITLLVFAGTSCGGPIERMLDEKLEEFRIKMRTGDPEIGLPVMAPLQLSKMHIEKFNFIDLMRLTGDIKNLLVENLDGFINNQLTFNVITMRSKFNFTYPNIKAQGFEDLEGTLFGLLPFWGYGKFYFNPVNVVIWGEARFSLTSTGYLNIRRFDCNLRIDHVNSRFDNLITGGDLSELLNEVIPDVTVSAVENFPEAVSDKLNVLLLPTLDKFFSSINIADFPKV